jgi:hypothetical protein
MADIEDIFNETVVEENNETGASKRRGKDDADNVPDGTYAAKIVEYSVFAKELPNGDKDYFTVMWFQVTSGPASGAELQSFSSVGPNSIRFIKRAIKTVTGSDPSWSDLYDKETGRTGRIQFDLIGKHVEITQKTKGKYSNIYIDKLIRGEDPEPMDDRNVDDLF